MECGSLFFTLVYDLEKSRQEKELRPELFRILRHVLLLFLVFADRIFRHTSSFLYR